MKRRLFAPKGVRAGVALDTLRRDRVAVAGEAIDHAGGILAQRARAR
jgi:hypothetical protein